MKSDLHPKKRQKILKRIMISAHSLSVNLLHLDGVTEPLMSKRDYFLSNSRSFFTNHSRLRWSRRHASRRSLGEVSYHWPSIGYAILLQNEFTFLKLRCIRIISDVPNRSDISQYVKCLMLFILLNLTYEISFTSLITHCRWILLVSHHLWRYRSELKPSQDWRMGYYCSKVSQGV